MRRVDCEGLMRALFQSLAYRLRQVQPQPADGARARANGVCAPMRHIQHAAYNAHHAKCNMPRKCNMPHAACIAQRCSMQRAMLHPVRCVERFRERGWRIGSRPPKARTELRCAGRPTLWELKESTPPPALCLLHACGRVFHAGASNLQRAPACTRRSAECAQARLHQGVHAQPRAQAGARLVRPRTHAPRFRPIRLLAGGRALRPGGRTMGERPG